MEMIIKKAFDGIVMTSSLAQLFVYNWLLVLKNYLCWQRNFLLLLQTWPFYHVLVIRN